LFRECLLLAFCCLLLALFNRVKKYSINQLINHKDKILKKITASLLINSNLIVSEVCLWLFRIEGLLKAKSDLIEGTIEEYFSNNRQFFWMTEDVRRRFIENYIL